VRRCRSFRGNLTMWCISGNDNVMVTKCKYIDTRRHATQDTLRHVQYIQGGPKNLAHFLYAL